MSGATTHTVPAVSGTPARRTPLLLPGAFVLQHLVEEDEYDGWLYGDCITSARRGCSARQAKFPLAALSDARVATG
ncbi:hypothetical protein ABTX62_05850 [Streptomyces sp. NPDC096046]|uniref:hypothetical protein n=1 Tax=Streptomyces sp. NPDC096046 TaxID=3155542 RepID=UPI003322F2F6